MDLKKWHLKARVNVLRGSHFEPRTMIITKRLVAFVGADGEEVDDVVPIEQLVAAKPLMHGEPERREGSWSFCNGMCAIETVPDGYNRGRAYCFTADFPLQIDSGACHGDGDTDGDGDTVTEEGAGRRSCRALQHMPPAGGQFSSVTHLTKCLEAVSTGVRAVTATATDQ
jgi:hypothetical protein